MSNDMALQAKAEPPREARGIVVGTDDPRRLMRVQVRVPGLWDGVPDADLPWAEYLLKGARGRGGDFEPAEVGDWVWVDFPSGDTRYPRITGWCQYAPSGVPNLPHEAFAGPESVAHKMNTDSGEPAPAAPQYHGSRVLEKHGVIVEVNPGGEYLVTQRATGTAVRITADGSVTVHSEAKLYLSSAGDTFLRAGGNFDMKVGGNWSIKVAGIIDETSAGHAMRKG